MEKKRGNRDTIKCMRERETDDAKISALQRKTTALAKSRLKCDLSLPRSECFVLANGVSSEG
jgi:hypothetical protein